MTNKENSLVYVWDAYCGWCHGFSESLKALHKNHPELPLEVLSGGLFTGAKKLPIASYPHIPEANNRIHQLTGAEFGETYQALLEDGTFLLDSEAAARGLAALRFFAPEKVYYLASAMQRAFYVEGKNLSDPEVYKEIAIANNLDPEKVLARFESEEVTEEVKEEFAKVQGLQVQSYPTLLLQKGDEYVTIGGGALNYDKLEERLKKALA